MDLSLTNIEKLMNTASLFSDSRGQSVRLPAGFELEGTEVYIKQIGRNILLIPKNNPWESLIRSLNKFTDDFMSEREQPLVEQREDL